MEYAIVIVIGIVILATWLVIGGEGED